MRFTHKKRELISKGKILNLPNALSFLRAPSALLFPIDNVALRTSLICLAMLSDFFDGYLARRYRHITHFGSIFDPIMDKFFVCFTLAILFSEKGIHIWEVAAMLSRDFSLILFSLYTTIRGKWKRVRWIPARLGKIMTSCQFAVLLLLTHRISCPRQIYLCLSFIGILVLFELLYTSRKSEQKPPISL